MIKSKKEPASSVSSYLQALTELHGETYFILQKAILSAEEFKNPCKLFWILVKFLLLQFFSNAVLSLLKILLLVLYARAQSKPD